MTSLLRKIMLCLLGLAAALAAWGGLELILFKAESLGGYFVLSLAEGLLIGLIFGFVFGSADGIMLSDKRRAISGGITGAVIGLITGALITVIVQGLLTFVFNAELFSRKTETGMVLPLARTLGWVVLGAVIGSVDGLRTRSGRRAGVGISGGALGGLLGGLVLELSGRYFAQGITGRGAGILLMGICIGLFYSIFESLRSYALVKVLTGDIRGKEYLLVSKKTLIGAGKRSAIALSGYRNMKDEHFVFLAGKDGVSIEALEGKVRVNEVAMDKKTLRYEDVIEAGSLKLIFLPVR